jgi:hypothetical protein
VAEGDINVVFAADTTQLDTAVQKVKAETQSLVPGAPGSGILTPLPAAFGGAPATLLERATAAAKANAAAAQEAGTAMKNFARAEDEAGESAGRAGINIGAMAERLATRLVIFEAIRLAIQGVKYAFDTISNLQQAQIQFNAMSDSVDHLAGRFNYLKEQAVAGLIDPEKAVQVRNTLQDFGATTDQAAMYVKDLGKWSNILGVDADKLAESLGRVAQGEGSLQDMRLVTHMMGEQGEAGRQLVQSLVDQENALKRLESQNAVVARSMEAVTRATEQMDERVTRSRTRGQEFLKETSLLPAIQAQLPKLAMHPEISPEYLQATGLLRLPHMGPGISPQVMNQMRDYITQYREGLKEIQKEEGLTDQAMRANARANIFSIDYVMRKAKDAHDDTMRNFREEGQAARLGMETKVTTAQAGIAATKAGLAVALPQAVTAPPTAQWEGFANSIKGIGLLTKEQFDTGIQTLVSEVGKVSTAADGTTAAVGGLENLFRGG